MALQIDEDLDLERRTWAAERIGWVLVFALIVLAIAGVFSHGPLSWTTTSSGALDVSYGRFERRGGEASLTVSVAEGAVAGTTARVAISSEYLDDLEITSVSPSPDSVASEPDAKVYSFALSSAGAPLDVVFEVTPTAMGRIGGIVSLPDGRDRVEVRQFVYP